MPRSYGRFTTSIWLDPDFTSLTLEQQGAYFTLGLQSDVSAAGLLPYTPRRWSRHSHGATREQIEKLVAELATHAGEHLVIDDDTEELLIRKFIKWDMGWANSKRLPVVIDAVCAISSVHIRDTAVDELRKLAASDMASPGQRKALSDAISPFDRVVVTKEGYEPQPLTATLEGEPPHPASPIPAGASAAPPPMFCTRHPEGTEDACGPCGRRREAYAAWAQAKTASDLEAKRATAEARRNCSRCNDRGILEHPDTGKPLGRCTHEAVDGGGAA